MRALLEVESKFESSVDRKKSNATFRSFQIYRKAFEFCNSLLFSYYYEGMLLRTDDVVFEPFEPSISAIRLANDVLQVVLDIDGTIYVPPSNLKL